ncbi:MAG: septal ring lytic transglycosylase RlpA family protein [Candidatus Edwardsbacteria bacterium]|nr:septal ring lytic transglycosylase RlpA family protein [Candidatus Edwardsbacteria bacterium]
MKYIIFLALIAFAGGWLYLWRFAWPGLARRETMAGDMLRSLAGGLVIVVLTVGWGMLMAHGCEKQYAAMDDIAAEISPQTLNTEAIGNVRAVCTYYSWPEHGRQTANGEIYDSLSFTCASLEKIPFGTRLCFVNPDNGRQVVCRINDRMPSKYWDTDRRFDLSRAAADSLGIIQDGKKELIIIKEE